MDNVKMTPVMVTREEFEEFMKCRMIVDNAIESFRFEDNGEVPYFVCVKGDLLYNFFGHKIKVAVDK